MVIIRTASVSERVCLPQRARMRSGETRSLTLAVLTEAEPRFESRAQMPEVVFGD
jgi:hypothetical protein